LWITNTSGFGAYFDLQISIDGGSTWVTKRDGEYIDAALMTIIDPQPNGTTILWRWRAGLSNPDSGNYTNGTSITISNCPTVPSITSLTSSNITSDSVTLNWTVSGPNIYITSNSFVWTGADWDVKTADSSGESVSANHSRTISSLSGNTFYRFQVCAYDGYSSGNVCQEITATTLIPIPNSQPAWTVLPFVSNSSGTQTNVTWTCTDDYSSPITNKIESQKFLPGYSPTYDGQVYSGTNSSGSSVTVTLTGLDPDYVYEYNVYCEDSSGYWSDRQVTLSTSR
jgi:hypothetical protein